MTARSRVLRASPPHPRRSRWWPELRTTAWESTIGRPAVRRIGVHIRAAAATVDRPVDVIDLGAGAARSLTHLGALGVPLASYWGIERDPVVVAAGRHRTSRHPRAQLHQGDIERLGPTRTRGPRLVLLTWVLSSMERPAATLELARRLAGPDGAVVVAAVTSTSDVRLPLDAWIRRRWRVRPVDPSILTPAATRFDVTLRGRAVVATISGLDSTEPPHPGTDRDPARALSHRWSSVVTLTREERVRWLT